MKITESQLKNALNAYFKCEAGDGLMNINMRAAIESLGIEVIPDSKTIIINGVEVPGPERVAPEVGTKYHAIDISSETLCVDLTWDNNRVDRRYLELGIVYLNERDCIAATNALLNALKEQP